MVHRFSNQIFVFILLNCFTSSTVIAQATFYKYFAGNFLKSHICTTNDDGFVIATKTSGSISLIKLNELGVISNSKTYLVQGSSPYVTSIIQTSDSGFVITATTNYVSYIIKTSSNLDSLWTKTIGIPGTQVKIGNIVELTGGNLIAFGVGENSIIYEHAFLIKMNSIGDSIFTRTLRRTSGSGGTTLQVRGIVTPDGGYMIQLDDWAGVVKTDSLGQEEWHYGSNNWGASPLSFSFDSSINGEYYISYMTILKLGIEKLDSLGNLIWRRILDLGAPVDNKPIIRSNPLGGFSLLARTNQYPVFLNGDTAGNIYSSLRIANTPLSPVPLQESDLDFTKDSGFVCLMDLNSGYLGIKKYNKYLTNCVDYQLSVLDTIQGVMNPLINIGSGYFPYQTYNDTILIMQQNFIINDICSNVGSVTDVWPGDCNYDLSVNNIDFVYLSIANSDSGSVRQNASINWIPQPSSDWVSNFNNDVNYKHADTNGDGTVDLTDTIAISQNYNNIHPFRFVHNTANATLNYFQLVAHQDTIFPGDTATFDIYINSASGTIDSLYGIAWSLAFDTSLVDSGYIHLNYVPSVLGTINSDLESFQKSFNSSGNLDLAISRTDQINATNISGIVGQLRLKTKNNISTTMLMHTFPLKIHALTYNQSEIPFAETGDSIVIYVSSNSVNETLLTTEFQIYPNPITRDIMNLNLKLPYAGIWNLEIMNAQGQSIKIYSINENELIQTIAIENLNPGLYNVRIIGETNMFSRKFIILQ